MFIFKLSTTLGLGVLTLIVALFSPSREIASADALVKFASGKRVQLETQRTNTGLMALLAMGTVSAAAWTITGNPDEADGAQQATASASKTELVTGQSVWPAAEPANTPQTAATLQALKRYVTSSAKNLMMVATGGSGKGMALSNMCRWRALADPSFVAVWCDPKNDADETGYFAHPSIRAFRFSGGKLSGPQIVEKVKALLKQYRALIAELPAKTPVWLILDEWTFLLSKLKKNDSALLDEVTDLLSSTISMLDAENKHIVLVGQSPILKDLLPGEGGLAANLNTLFLFKRDDSAAKMIVKAGQARIIPGAISNQESLYNVCSYSPRERAMFFDGQLWPAPELKNFGNYDRDERSHLGKSLVSITNYADTKTPTIAAPIEFDAESVVPTSTTADALTSMYERSPSAAQPLHPKVKQFVAVVEKYWSKNPGESNVPLSKLIQSDHALKKANRNDQRAIIEQVMLAASALSLIQVHKDGDTWRLLKPEEQENGWGDSDF